MLLRVDAKKTAIIADLRRIFEASVRASDDRIAMAEALFRERLAESERNKEIYLRFAVSINEQLNSGIDQIMAAREIARQLAHETADGKRLPERPAAPQPKQLDEIEQMIAEAVTEARGEARPATANSEGQSGEPMEADAELRAFLRRDEHLAPTGFVTRVISACRNNQELRNDGHCHPAPVTTIEQLKNSSWHYWHNVGKKSIEHRRYLFEKNWEDSTSAVAVDGTCKWCGRDTSRDVPARKDNRILRNWHGQARRIHNRVSVKREETQHDDSQEFHKALADAGLQYSGLSWSGFAVFGDERSIAEMKRLQHLAGMVPDLQKQLAEAQRIPKLRSRR